MTVRDELEAIAAAAGLRFDRDDPMTAFARALSRLSGFEGDEVLEMIGFLMRHDLLTVDEGYQWLRRYREERSGCARGG